MKLISPILAALILSGCFDPIPCTVDSECGSGQICGADGCDPDIAVDSTNNTTGTNNSTNTNSTTPHTNGTPNPVNGSLESLRQAYPDSGCLVDPADTTCATPSGNEAFEIELSSGTGVGGCKWEDNFNAIDFTSSLEICKSETTASYSTNLALCRGKAFILEIYVTPKVKCDPALYDLEVLIGDQSCAKPTNKLRCTSKPDGSWHIQALMEPGPTVLSPSVQLTPKFDRVISFEYDLRFLTRE